LTLTGRIAKFLRLLGQNIPMNRVPRLTTCAA
jgi:hypothetical protein